VLFQKNSNATTLQFGGGEERAIAFQLRSKHLLRNQIYYVDSVQTSKCSLNNAVNRINHASVVGSTHPTKQKQLTATLKLGKDWKTGVPFSRDLKRVVA
jgi:hypothetical protein